jgi:FlaA1/EpsC-like NDP-sugar epimerase
VRGLVLAGCDLVALNAAFLIAFGVRKLLAAQFAKPLFTVADYWQFLLVFNLATLVALRRYGLYASGRALSRADLLRRVTRSVVLAALAVLVSTFLLYIRAYSRFVIGLTVPLAITAIAGARLLLGRFMDHLAREGLAARRVLLIGDRELAAWMAERLGRAGRPHFEIVGTVDPATHLRAEPGHTRARLRDLCHRERVQEVIIADRDGSLAGLARAAAPLAREGVRIRLLGPWSRELVPGVRIEETAGVELLVPPPAGDDPGA